MDLRSKLGLYKEGAAKPSAPLRPQSENDIDRLVPGYVVSNSFGCCYVIEQKYPLTHIYGSCRLGDILGTGGDILVTLGGEDCEGLAPEKLLFLDTETTGLSGGAGTLAFLVGVGFFEGDSYIVRQYFIRDYDEEAAMLSELQQLFARHGNFVTFNGKAFDINLLQSRFISNRFRARFGDFPHLDLLYPARRVWGLKLESCRLSSLEENVLGEHRTDDIPGALIPSVYFKYLEDRNASDIMKVIHHNRLDVLSMVSLLARLSAMLKSPLSETDGGFELLGMGRLFEANGRTEDMLECLEACSGSGQFDVKVQAVKRLTGIYKKNGSIERALEHWKAVEAENPSFELFHLIEMAKYYEHKEKNYKRALPIVEKAVQKCLNAGLGGSTQLEELKKRRDRIVRKLQSQNKSLLNQ
ncbi:MAG TPA: ribonuclease H-like domain-containing protein [Clostridia bacterium]|nr:ribonuclease H-like domain-containing protein [Clostridia bacterium]